MKYMPILPVGMSRLFEDEGISSAFILPQFWANPSYARMYTGRTWDTVIIDNAMYENPNPVPFHELIEIAQQLKSTRTFVVAPEDHKDPIHTAELTIKAIEEYGTHGPKWIPMCIIHGTPHEISSMFYMLDDIPTLGYGVTVSCWRNGFDRAFLRSLSKGGHYFHAMGLDSISEGVTLKRAGFNSVDSSMPATAAFNDIQLSFNTVIYRTGKPTDPVRVPLLQEEFLVDCTKETVRNIRNMTSWFRW